MSDGRSDIEVEENDSLGDQFSAFIRLHRQHGWSDEIAQTAHILWSRIAECERKEQYLRSQLDLMRHNIDKALRRYM